MRLREAMLSNSGATTSRKNLTLDNEKYVFVGQRASYRLYFLQAVRTQWVEAYAVLCVY